MRNVFRGIWRGLNLSRIIILNLVFFFFFFLFLAGLFSAETPSVPDGAALLVAPQGELVDELAGLPVERAIDHAMGQGKPQTLLRDLVFAIRAAADDERITALVLDLSGLEGSGLTKLQELAAALDAFKASGKPVIALGDSYSQAQYLVAAHADEVLMHPMGMVIIDGYGRYLPYFKDLSEKLAVDWNVVRVGEYKSAVEPFLRNDMSAADEKASLAFLSVLWDVYQNDVTTARGLQADAVAAYVKNIVTSLAANDGDTAQLALQAGLVDQLASREQMRQRIIDITGVDQDSGSFKQIDAALYAKLQQPLYKLKHLSANHIAVLVASGEIRDGAQPPGTVGGDTLAAQIRDARQDEKTKAIVLRVDSPGGSAFASEVIRQELTQVQAAGIPVVVSMSTLAASGGYWISMSADEIFAHPATITGSIGIFGMFPTFEKSLDKIGVHVDGVGTTWLAGAFSPARSLDPQAKALLQEIIQHGYQQFIGNVAESRELELARVKEIAQGRVWSGRDALELGLVDKLGGLDDAIAAAAELAGVADDYSVQYVEPKLSFSDKLLMEMLAGPQSLVTPVLQTIMPNVPLQGVWQDADRLTQLLATFNDPRGVYAYCFCRVQ